MKVKFAILTLLLVGLLGIATNAFAVPTIAINKDVARTVAAGDSAVAVAYSITNPSGSAAMTVLSMTFDGSGGTLLTLNATAGTGDISNATIYEDININGVMDPGVDEPVKQLTAAEIAAVAGGTTAIGVTGTGVEFAASEKKYYVLVVAVKKQVSAAADNKLINVTARASDAGGISAGTATPAANTTLQIAATHLEWVADSVKPLAAAGATLIDGANNDSLIEAVDDYGNLDTDFVEQLVLSNLTYPGAATLGTLTASANGGTVDYTATGVNANANMVGGKLLLDADGSVNSNNAIDVLTVTPEANVILYAYTTGATKLQGTITVTIGAAYTDGSGIASSRGVEVYDTDHNGKIDRVALFFDQPIYDNWDAAGSAAGSDGIPDEGTANVTNTAFTVTGYTLDATKSPMLSVDNGGYGIKNGGKFAITLYLVEGSSYDTNATPQVVYNPPALAPVWADGTGAVPQVVAATATEVDKASPIIVTRNTVDANGNGKVDGIVIGFSEPVDGVTVNPTKVTTDPTTYAFALRATNQKDVNTVLTLTGATTTSDNKTFTLGVTEGAFLTTDEVPVVLYNQFDAEAYVVVDNATDVNGVPARNQLLVDKTISTAKTNAVVNVNDGVSAVVLNVTTNDSDLNGKLDKFTVEFSEEVGVKFTGVNFSSSVFGTYTSTSAVAVTGKIINYTVAEKGTGIYDTESTPTLAYDPTATGTKLFDFGGNELALYGTGGRTQVNATADNAAPIIVTVTSGDVLTDEDYAGNTTFEATGANGRLDRLVVVFSEKVTTTNYSTTANATNFLNAIAQFDIQHEDGTIAGTVGYLKMLSPDPADVGGGFAAGAPGLDTYDPKAVPTWQDDPSGDSKTTLTLYFGEVTHANLTTAGLSANGGDTGVRLKLNYDKAAVADNFKDAAGNTTPTVALKNADDGAAPFIVNGLKQADGTAKDLAKGWTNLLFSNIFTVDSDAVTYGSDYLTGDGYIDAFKVQFSEQVIVTQADTTSMAAAWEIGNGTGNSTIAMNIGFDITGDGRVNKTAAGVTDTSDNTAGAAGFHTATLFGTSSKIKDKFDTGNMPTVKYLGGAGIRDAANNNMVASYALPSYDQAAPVPVVAVGGVKTKEIKVTWSENVYSDNAGTATWGTIKAADIFGYNNTNSADNAALSTLTDVSVTNSVMVLATVDTLTLADVQSDSIWVKTAAKVFDKADQQFNTQMAAGTNFQNEAEANAVGVGYKIIINDILAPYITDAYTVDVNGNGKIDHIRFKFSEPIKLESIGGYTGLNKLSDNVQLTWQFEGYSGSAQWNLFTATDAGKIAAYTANEPVFTDAQINTPTSYVFYLKLQEDLVPAGVTGVGSTGYAPVLTVVNTGPYAVTMSDNKPNILDVNSNETGAVKTGMIVKDNVGPVLMNAKYISGTELKATFSEDVALASVKKESFYWKLSTDGDQGSAANGWAQNIVRITEPSTGALVLKVTDDYDWEDDMVGTLAVDNGTSTITDDAKTLGTGYGGTAYTDAAAVRTAVAAGGVAYANATYYKATSATNPAATADATKGIVAANVAIAIDWTAPVNPGGSTGPSVIAAPANLVLADVPNDNGHWMFATFTVSADHLTYVKSYQFYRQVNFGTEEAPNLQWVYSAVVPAGYKDVNNKSVCLVPVITDGEGEWAVVASSGDVISDMALTSKEGEIPVAMLVDGAEKVAGMVLSDMATAVGGAIDNIAPTAVEAFAITSAEDGSGVVLSWTAPADNGIVGYYGNGVVNNIPIYGVESYEVYRKTGSAEFALVGTAAAGSSSYTDAMSPASTVYTYYVKSVDSNPEHLVVSSNRSGIAASPLQGDFTGDSIVNASDFSIFAAAYGKKAVDNEEAYVWSYDLTNDGIINASDFSVFAAKYGSTLPTAKAAIAEMPTSDLPFTFSANVDDATSTYFLNVNIGKSDALKGFEFFLSYDKENFEFLPNSVNGLVGLNMTAEVEDGIIRVTDWFVGEEFDGTVSFGFKTSGLNRTSTFEILNAMVDDVNGLAAATNFSEFEARALPTVYTLSQNYPNPFNPTTTIDYAMPKSGNVELVIFNTSGQKVRTLVSNVQDAGFYKVVWDGRNDLGEQVASGVYIYKLAADSFSKTAKMNLVK